MRDSASAGLVHQVGRSARTRSCKEGETQLWRVWKRPEFALDLLGKEGPGGEPSGNVMLQVLQRALKGECRAGRLFIEIFAERQGQGGAQLD